MSRPSCAVHIFAVVTALSPYLAGATVSVESILNGTVVGSWAAPYFTLGNTSFDVTASALYVAGSADDQAVYDQQPIPLPSNSFVAIDSTATTNYQGWADACSRQALSCRGLIVINCAEPDRAYVAWTFRSAGSVPFTDVPMVILTPGQTLDLTTTFRNEGRQLLRMTSQTAPNTAFTTNGPWIIWAIAFALEPVLAVITLAKVVAFCVTGHGRVRRPPFAPVFALSVSFLCAIGDAYFVGNIALCDGRCAPYNLTVRFIRQSESSISCATTLTLTYMLQQAYVQTGGVDTRWSYLRRLFSWSTACVVIIAGVTSNVLDLVALKSTGSSLVYVVGVFILYFVAYVAFIRQGRCVAEQLLQCKGVSAGERRRRLRFAVRIVRSGVSGLLMLIALTVVGAATAVGNVTLFWYSYAVASAFGVLQRIMEALTFQTPAYSPLRFSRALLNGGAAVLPAPTAPNSVQPPFKLPI